MRFLPAVVLFATLAIPLASAEGPGLPPLSLASVGASPTDQRSTTGGACPVVTETRGATLSADAGSERASVLVGQRRTSDSCTGAAIHETIVVVSSPRANGEAATLSVGDSGGDWACVLSRAVGHQPPYACAPFPTRHPYAYDLLP